MLVPVGHAEWKAGVELVGGRAGHGCVHRADERQLPDHLAVEQRRRLGGVDGGDGGEDVLDVVVVVDVLILQPRQKLDVALLLGHGDVRVACEGRAGLGHDARCPHGICRGGHAALGHAHVGGRVTQEAVDGGPEFRRVDDLEILEQRERTNGRRPCARWLVWLLR